MSFPLSPYLEQEDGALRIKGTRVGIEPIVVRFQEGASPEKIADSFPTVTLAQVYGAIAYYLDNKQLIDEYMAESQRVLEKIPRLFEAFGVGHLEPVAVDEMLRRHPHPNGAAGQALLRGRDLQLFPQRPHHSLPQRVSLKYSIDVVPAKAGTATDGAVAA